MYTIYVRTSELVNTGIPAPPNDCAEVITMRPYGHLDDRDKVSGVLDELRTKHDESDILIKVDGTYDSADETLILARDWDLYMGTMRLIRLWSNRHRVPCPPHFYPHDNV